MRKIKVCIILIFWIFPLLCFAQYFSKSININNDSNNGWQIETNEDNEIFILSGNICNNNTTPCIGLIKLNEAGEVIWMFTIDTLDLQIQGALLLDEEKIFILAHPLYFESNRVVLLELDQEGNLVNHRTFGEDLVNVSPNDIKKYGDGYLLNLRYGITADEHGRIEIYDHDFNFIRATDYEENYGYFSWGMSNVTENMDVLIANRYRALNDEGIPVSKALFTKINAQGEKEWEKTFDYGSLVFTPLPSLIDLKNDTYAANWKKEWAGEPWIFNWLTVVYGLDIFGEVIWEQDFSFIPRSDFTTIAKLFTAQNGDIIGLGSDDYFEYHPEIGSSAWIFRLNNQGEMLWQRAIADYRAATEDLAQYLIWGKELDNGDLIFSGYIRDTLDNGSLAGHVWLLKTNANGCLIPNCGTTQFIMEGGVITTPTEELEKPTTEKITIFPNPTSGFLTIDLPVQRSKLQIFDILGSLVFQKKLFSNQEELDISHLSKGCYFVKVGDYQAVRIIKF